MSNAPARVSTSNSSHIGHNAQQIVHEGTLCGVEKHQAIAVGACWGKSVGAFPIDIKFELGTFFSVRKIFVEFYEIMNLQLQMIQKIFFNQRSHILLSTTYINYKNLYPTMNITRL